jgi:SHS2 domain-containing protein
MPFEELEHTADRALRVWAGDLPGLFVEAARGMFSLVADLAGDASPRGWDPISLDAIDHESLLVEWLNELLFLAEDADHLFVAFRIEHLSSTQLCAQAGWVPGHPTKAHIKAATYHDLQIVETNGALRVELTFDT